MLSQHDDRPPSRGRNSHPAANTAAASLIQRGVALSDDTLLSTEKLAEYLDCQVSWVHDNWKRRLGLHPVRLGRQLRFRLSEVTEVLAANLEGE